MIPPNSAAISSRFAVSMSATISRISLPGYPLHHDVRPFFVSGDAPCSDELRTWNVLLLTKKLEDFHFDLTTFPMHWGENLNYELIVHDECCARAWESWLYFLYRDSLLPTHLSEKRHPEVDILQHRLYGNQILVGLYFW